MIFSNNLMEFSDGTPVLNSDDMKCRQKELITILENNAYGKIPPVCGTTTFETVEQYNSYSADKANFSKIKINVPTEKGIFSFPIVRISNKSLKKTPTFVFINFRNDIFDRYCPVEEIIDNGFNIIQVCYNDITNDDGDFTNGLALHFDRSDSNAPGKISLWSWALSRIIDIVLTLPETDVDNIAVVGHSRLGKTALWCGANDNRVKYVISNNSGCMGAALNCNKHENAEKYTDIVRNFPYWFCKKFVQDVKLNKIPNFDQHYLLACSAPRYVIVSSANDDLWADPVSEYDCCKFSSPAFDIFGIKGFVSEDEYSVINKYYNQGHIAYRKRPGTHFLSRDDWNFFCDFINKHK